MDKLNTYNDTPLTLTDACLLGEIGLFMTNQIISPYTQLLIDNNMLALIF